MRRREFVCLIGGAAAWPLKARAQQPAKQPTIGFLGSGTLEDQGQWVAAFLQRLRELGWIEGRNITIEYDGRREAVIAPPNSRRSSSDTRSMSLLPMRTQ